MISLFLSFALASEINVMIVDTGVSPAVKEIMKYVPKNQDTIDLVDTSGHGTHVAGLILYGYDLKSPVCNNVKLHVCRFKYDGNPTVKKSHLDCFREAVKLKIDVINFSAVGDFYYDAEESMIKYITSNGIKINVAAGNEKRDISKIKMYPASYKIKGMTTVGNGITAETRHFTSNYGIDEMIWRFGESLKSFDVTGKGYKFMTGSSQSTAIYTHDMLITLCKEKK